MAHLDPDNRVYPPGHHGEPGFEATCAWFAKCANPANGVADCRPLGHIPVCKRCADKVVITEFVAGGIV